MRLLRIEIEQFGKLRDLTLEPERGITLIEGENESGKSTVLAFLRFAFYGFPRKNGQDGEERDKRLSWLERTAAGRLTLERDGKQYRISRRCMLRGSAAREALVEELSVISLPDGNEVDMAGKTPGELLLGIPAELYDGSLSLVQSDADRVVGAGMEDAVSEHLFSGEAALSADAAQGRLQNARRELQHVKGRGGRIAELEDRIVALDRDISRALEEQRDLSAARTESRRCRALIREKRQELQRLDAAAEAAELERALVLFEDRDRARAEELRCRRELEQLGMAAAEELPDKEQLARIGEALPLALRAEEEIERIAAERTQLQAAKYDEKLLNGARKMQETGGGEAWLGRVERKARTARSLPLLGGILTALGVGVSALYFLGEGIWRYAPLGGAAAMLIGICLLIAGAAAALGKRRLLSAIGVGGMTMLRTHLLQCEREAEAYRLHRERMERLDADQTLLEQERERAMAILQAEMAALGRAELGADAVQITAYLEQLGKRKAELQAAFSEATVAYERAKGVSEALSLRLEGLDEAALRERKRQLAVDFDHNDALRDRRGQSEETLRGLEQRLTEAERREASLAATAGDPDALQRERAALAAELETDHRRLAALRLALEGLQSAADAMRRELLPRLGTLAASTFAQLTEGVHGTLYLQNDFSLMIEEDGFLRPLSHFSAGCRDAAHLSLRLALLETVSKEKLPLFFDEAFSRLDDRRTAQLLRLLQQYCAEGGQCLLFTCHTREREMLAGDAAVGYIRLH